MATVLVLVGPTLIEEMDDNDPSVRELAEKEGIIFVTYTKLTDGAVDANNITAIVVCGHAVVDKPLLDRLPNVKVVSNYGVGVDHIDKATQPIRPHPTPPHDGFLHNCPPAVLIDRLLGFVPCPKHSRRQHPRRALGLDG